MRPQPLRPNPPALRESLQRMSAGDISQPDHNKVTLAKFRHRPHMEYTLYDMFILSFCVQWRWEVCGDLSSGLWYVSVSVRALGAATRQRWIRASTSSLIPSQCCDFVFSHTSYLELLRPVQPSGLLEEIVIWNETNHFNFFCFTHPSPKPIDKENWSLYFIFIFIFQRKETQLQ